MKDITKEMTLWIYRELPNLDVCDNVGREMHAARWNAYRKRINSAERKRLEAADRALSIFKLQALRTPKSQRMALLKDLANRKIERRCMSQYWIKTMRAEFEQVKHKIKLKGQCWVCDAPAELRHHIIQLQHGGRNIERNIVLLCCSCHAEIHPWLRQ
jgi:hypothetical protein